MTKMEQGTDELNMFSKIKEKWRVANRFVFCDEKTYRRVERISTISGDMMSQEDLTFCGVKVGVSQPNMMDDPDFTDDIFWCRQWIKNILEKK